MPIREMPDGLDAPTARRGFGLFMFRPLRISHSDETA